MISSLLKVLLVSNAFKISYLGLEDGLICKGVQVMRLQLDPQNLCANGKKKPSSKNLLPSLHMHSLACMAHTHIMLTLPQFKQYLTAFFL